MCVSVFAVDLYLCWMWVCVCVCVGCGFCVCVGYGFVCVSVFAVDLCLCWMWVCVCLCWMLVYVSELPLVLDDHLSSFMTAPGNFLVVFVFVFYI